MNAVSSPRVPRRTLLLANFAVAMAATPPADARAKTDERATSSCAASIASVTTQEFRVAVVATRLTGGATPTADVRVAIAQGIAGRWREKGETRLKGTYFWRTSPAHARSASSSWRPPARRKAQTSPFECCSLRRSAAASRTASRGRRGNDDARR